MYVEKVGMNPALQNPSWSQRTRGPGPATRRHAPWLRSLQLGASFEYNLKVSGSPSFSSFVTSASFPSFQSLPFAPLLAHTTAISGTELLALFPGGGRCPHARAPCSHRTLPWLHTKPARSPPPPGLRVASQVLILQIVWHRTHSQLGGEPAFS